MCHHGDVHSSITRRAWHQNSDGLEPSERNAVWRKGGRKPAKIVALPVQTLIRIREHIPRMMLPHPDAIEKTESLAPFGRDARCSNITKLAVYAAFRFDLGLRG